MSKSLNQALLMGNLTADPETRSLPSGAQVTSFSLALNRNYQDANKEWKETTTYLDVVTFGKLAETVSERLKKGSRVLVDGRIEHRTWEKDGKKYSKYEIAANDVTFLDVKSIEVKDY